MSDIPRASVEELRRIVAALKARPFDPEALLRYERFAQRLSVEDRAALRAVLVDMIAAAIEPHRS